MRDAPLYDRVRVDLTNCDREAIHLLGRVQDWAALISVTDDERILHVSHNVERHLGVTPEALLGTKLDAHFSRRMLHDLRGRMHVLSDSDLVARLFRYPVFDDARLFDISVHAAGQATILEFEPSDAAAQREDVLTVQALIARVRRRPGLPEIVQEAARGLQALAGFDRVMVYQFLGDGSGSVIAEAAMPGLPPYLGLRYPASDIPRQARELYRRSHLRLIADVDGPTSDVLGAEGGDPLDLSLAMSRSVSDIHLEYLRNMGVSASMSVSILRGGELWGLFACHHYSPRHIGYEQRTTIELFAQLLSYELAEVENRLERETAEHAATFHDSLMRRVSGGHDMLEAFDEIAEQIGRVIAFDGIAMFADGRYRSAGAAASREEFEALAPVLHKGAATGVYATDALRAEWPGAGMFGGRVAGVLALPMSRLPRDYIVLFRREVLQTVTWAGNPDKSVEADGDGRISPRKSFAAWNELRRDRSEPWSEADLRFANALRLTLVEVILKMTDEAHTQQQRASAQQELLIAELNHRVRNILNLIRGLVSQGRGETATIEDFAADLDGRIHALARAHDQLTRTEWASGSIRSLIEVEVSAFLRDAPDRIVIRGPDIHVTPEAFSTLALVMHELVTNSAKYGGLSDRSGRVVVTLSMSADDEVVIAWREEGGPAVSPPTRRGFGTMIIEKSIPYELHGTSELTFAEAGVQARITLPGGLVRSVEDVESDAVPAAPALEASAGAIAGNVLLVEDNMIIALDAQDILLELGAEQVFTASTVREALRLLEAETVTLAVLDVNLRAETSLRVAEELAAAGIPFLLATGYSGADTVTAEFPDAPLIAKPYGAEDLRAALAEIARRSGGRAGAV